MAYLKRAANASKCCAPLISGTCWSGPPGLAMKFPCHLWSYPPKFTVLGMTACVALPAPAWEGRRGAEAALVSRGSYCPQPKVLSHNRVGQGDVNALLLKSQIGACTGSTNRHTDSTFMATPPPPPPPGGSPECIPRLHFVSLCGLFASGMKTTWGWGREMPGTCLITNPTALKESEKAAAVRDQSTMHLDGQRIVSND